MARVIAHVARRKSRQVTQWWDLELYQTEALSICLRRIAALNRAYAQIRDATKEEAARMPCTGPQTVIDSVAQIYTHKPGKGVKAIRAGDMQVSFSVRNEKAGEPLEPLRDVNKAIYGKHWSKGNGCYA